MQTTKPLIYGRIEKKEETWDERWEIKDERWRRKERNRETEREEKVRASRTKSTCFNRSESEIESEGDSERSGFGIEKASWWWLPNWHAKHSLIRWFKSISQSPSNTELWFIKTKKRTKSDREATRRLLARLPLNFLFLLFLSHSSLFLTLLLLPFLTIKTFWWPQSRFSLNFPDPFWPFTMSD